MTDCLWQEIPQLQVCALQSLTGDLLGSGVSRRVYELKHNPDLVIKVEHRARDFCNVNEWNIWNAVEKTKWAKWFAEVVEIDVWGGTLIMRRTTPVTYDDFQKKVKALPDFMDDMHYANFGWLDGRIVCHDYGYDLALDKAVKGAVLKPVKKKESS